MKALLVSVIALCLMSTIVLAAPQTGGTDPFARKVTLELKDVSIDQAIDSLLKDSGINYAIEGAGEETINAVLRNVDLSQALKQVVRAAGMVYIVEGSDTSPFVRIRRKPGLDNQDWPEPEKRQGVRIKLTTDLTVKALGKTTPYNVSTESTGAEGYGMPLEINSSKTITTYNTYNTSVNGKAVENKSPVYSTQGFWVQCMLTPSFGSDGTGAVTGMTLSGNGTIRGILPMDFSKAFDVAVPVALDKPTIIAGGSSDLGDMSVEFTVKALVSLTGGEVPAPRSSQMPGFGGFGAPGIGGRPSYGPGSGGSYGGSSYGAPGFGGGFQPQPPGSPNATPGLRPGSGAPGYAPDKSRSGGSSGGGSSYGSSSGGAAGGSSSGSSSGGSSGGMSGSSSRSW